MTSGYPKSAAYKAWLQTPEAKRRQKHRDLLRSRGVKLLVDAAETQSILRHYSSVLGVPRATLARLMGISVASIQNHVLGYSPGGRPVTVCRQDFADRVARGARLVTPDDCLYPAALGTRRRVQALVAQGYGFKWQGERYGQDIAQVHAFAHAKSVRTKRQFALLVSDTYEKYAFRDPAEVGQTPFTVAYAKGVALKYGWAPPHCWDDDTLDNAEAFAEWTGQCGTANGFRIHCRNRIPLCDQCSKARQIYNRYPHLGELMGVVTLGHRPDKARQGKE